MAVFSCLKPISLMVAILGHLFALNGVVTSATSVPIDEFSVCKAWGDPHFTTFDSNIFHFQGEGYFDYVKECNGELNDGWNVPVTISGKHESCGNDVSCLTEVLVQIQYLDENGQIAHSFIAYPNGGYWPIYKYAQTSAIGTHTFTGQNGDITVTVGHNNFYISFITNNGLESFIQFNYATTTLIIETPASSMGNSLSGDLLCGLCGTLNNNQIDDFTKCNNYEMIEFKQLNANIFGESCCRKDLDLKFIGTSDCDPSYPPIGPPTLPPPTCTDIAEGVCISAYYQFCTDCINTEPDEEFITGCAYDICSVTECANYISNLGTNTFDIDYLLSIGCLDTSINFCEVNCKQPTLMPTNVPTPKEEIDPCDIDSWINLAGESVTIYEHHKQSVHDHYYSFAEKISGWTDKGPSAKIWTKEVEGVLFPWRIYTKQANGLVDHFYTTATPPIKGWSYKGILGYVMNKECEGFNVPYYKYFSSELLDHFYKTSIVPNTKYYKYQGVGAYVQLAD